ncbi:MAG: glycoside hydrolase family 2 protein [Chitinophagaceae bacterium]
MKGIFRNGFLSFFLQLVLVSSLWAQSGPVKQVELTRFQLQSSSLIAHQGNLLSKSNYHSRVYWFPVKVPCTVLTGLVANHIYPDPYSGLNNMLIPDASDSFNREYHLEQYSFLANEPNPWKKPYWYRTTFVVPGTDQGRSFQLIFKGINYRAEVWVNGQKIADSSQMAGMFAEYSLDVSKVIDPGEINALAVKIYPLDYPGLPSTEQLKALGDFYPNGGPTGDIGKNVTMLCTAGWDWIPPVRDRNMGIWQPVYLRTTGAVSVGHAQIKTNLPHLPQTDMASLSLHLTLYNHQNYAQKGNLRVIISPENFIGTSISFMKSVSLSGHDSRVVDLNADQEKQLLIHQPHLWWPNGYGPPNLYRIHLQYVMAGKVSDDTSFLFGIRTISSIAVNVHGYTRRDFYVNGKRVHLVGGAWVPDMMLNRDSTRYDEELHLCQNDHLNLVRIWGGGIAPPDVFFELADRYGLMVWQDFWITGDTNGQFKGSSNYPLDGDLFIRNVVSTIRRIRNHPSLVIWTGGNEGHARKKLYDAMRNQVIQLDGTRPFIPCSSGFAQLPSDWKQSWPDNQPSGVYSGGPYAWRDPAVYYQLVDAGKDWVFKDETGIPSQPPYTNLKKIIPNLTWDTTLPFPLNNSWGYHDACTGNGHYDLYYDEMVKRYGAPKSMRDFSEKMQFMNAEGYQGIFESAEHKLSETGGVMLWKLNAAFPSVIWQIYDWYLEPNAGYYFIQNACQQVHIQLNLDDSAVAVVNRTYQPQQNLKVLVRILDLDGKTIYTRQATISVGDAEAKESVSLLRVLAKTKGISFVVLDLKNEAGSLISHNVYWMSPQHNFLALNHMKVAQVTLKVLKAVQNFGVNKWTIQFSNPSRELAFFVRPQLERNGHELLPSFWSGSYFSLAPGQDITLTVSCRSSQLLGAEASLRVKGWNVPSQRIKLGGF